MIAMIVDLDSRISNARIISISSTKYNGTARQKKKKIRPYSNSPYQLFNH